MLKVEEVEEHEWKFVYPPKYDPEIRQWLIQKAGKGKRSKTDKVLES